MDVLAGEEQIASLYEFTGPFVTVYLDATRSTETGPQEVEVRWRDVSEDLEKRGADGATLNALADAIAADYGTPGPHGLVLVGTQGRLVFADRLHNPPAHSRGVLAPLPHLMPYLAQRATDVPHVVVVADRTGADILLVPAGGETTTEQVKGQVEWPLHRTSADAWNERHFQTRVENNWEHNARDVADAVRRLVAERTARLIVVAGDVRARNMIAEELQRGLPLGVRVDQVEEGGRAPGASTAALEAAVHDRVLRQAWRERREVLEHLAQNLGRHRFGVAGVAEVADALRMSQADTVVLSDDPSSTLRAWIGPLLTEFGLDDSEADAMGIDTVAHDRYDAALVRAVVGTGAKFVVTPGAHEYVKDGIGALLRYETLDTPYR
ncbi:MAG TPA: Vms1/Ankzf1 family peptidyl-tRNA hydrolase [Jatrophihabitans sp.]|nr:Vms1/Ankzf1 family peptidyl-tRNA hydrolase [Jatrophihabitans sp.]